MPAKHGIGCLPMLGWLIFLYSTVKVASNYGRTWVVGWYGPVTLLAPDGLHYPDGTPLDPISLALASSGLEQVVFWGLLLLSVFFLAYAFYLARKTERIRRQMLETSLIQAELYRLARERRGNPQA